VRPSARAGGRGALATPGAVATLAVSFAMAVGFGCIDASLAATARDVLHDESLIGVLFTAIAGGSAVGGLVYGARHVPVHVERRHLPVLLGVFAAGLAPLSPLLHAGRPSLWAFLPLLFLAGLSIAPALLIQQSLVDATTAPDRNGEAQAWLSTSHTTGGAAGTALAGVLLDQAGVSWSLGGAAVAVAGAAAGAVSAQRWWRAATG
ncbi:MAG: MFS transporter, partial [Actinomycetota bacterium]|nr:MFS transporter [Actinomycetota bacterium]